MSMPQIDPDKWFCGRVFCCRNGEDYLPPKTCDKACCPNRIPRSIAEQPAPEKQIPDRCKHYDEATSECKINHGLCFLDVTGWDCSEYTPNHKRQ